MSYIVISLEYQFLRYLLPIIHKESMNSLGIQVITFWELDPLNHSPSTSEGTDPYGLSQKNQLS